MNNCPICDAPALRAWKSETGKSDFVLFPCGLEMRNQEGAPGWKRKFGTYCKKDLTVVSELKEKLNHDKI